MIKDRKLNSIANIRNGRIPLDELALLATYPQTRSVHMGLLGGWNTKSIPNVDRGFARTPSTLHSVIIGGEAVPNRNTHAGSEELFPQNGSKEGNLDETALLLSNQISEAVDPVATALLSIGEGRKRPLDVTYSGLLKNEDPSDGLSARRRSLAVSKNEDRPKTTLELDKRSSACEHLISSTYKSSKKVHDIKMAIQNAEATIYDYRGEIKQLTDEQSELAINVPDGVGKRKKGNKTLEKIKDGVGNVELVSKAAKIAQIDQRIAALKRIIRQKQAHIKNLNKHLEQAENQLSINGNELGKSGCKYSPAEVKYLPR